LIFNKLKNWAIITKVLAVPFKMKV